MKKLLLLILFLGIGFCCFFDFREESHHAVYFWKTKWQSSEQIESFLKKNKIERIYFRFFDIDQERDEASPHPVASLLFVDPLPKQIEVVPVVFIKNRVLLRHTYSPQILAQKVADKIKSMLQAQHLPEKELQVDCDWTLDTKDYYFSFLKELRRMQPQHAVLSATIRLHQVKYLQKTGVPPVDRGMLMFYNLGTLQAQDGRNSIFNEKDASRYVSYVKKYPLELDVVLPIFSWAVQIRGNEIVNLIEKTAPQDFSEKAMFSPLTGSFVNVTKAGFFHGVYFQKEDRLKFEILKAHEIIDSAKLIKNFSGKRHFRNVAIFDLDAKNVNRYDEDLLENIFSIFN